MRSAGVDLDVLAPEGYRSPCVTAIKAGGDVATEAPKKMKERGYVIGGGYGKLKPTTFRIGHMGDHTLDGLNGMLDVLTEVVK
jgi:aspartate aminotransferase-like enzyme